MDFEEYCEFIDKMELEKRESRWLIDAFMYGDKLFQKVKNYSELREAVIKP